MHLMLGGRSLAGTRALPRPIAAAEGVETRRRKGGKTKGKGREEEGRGARKRRERNGKYKERIFLDLPLSLRGHRRP